MYVPKTHKLSTVPFSRDTIVVRVVRDEDDFAFNVKLELSTFPCGRVRIIARAAGLIVTGDMSNVFKDITFDSVKSLYNVPGVRVLTHPDVVYAACGKRPYGNR